MITDLQVRKLRKDLRTGMTLATAAVRAGMSEKTARKYRNMPQLPSELIPATGPRLCSQVIGGKL